MPTTNPFTCFPRGTDTPPSPSHPPPSGKTGGATPGRLRARRRRVRGEIVQVEGGHIVSSTWGKDRHSKVFTAKGLRDCRIRLSAPTAIQFYDVLYRLGYDRPSKAVDWLIKNAKPAINKLAKIPSREPPAPAVVSPAVVTDTPTMGEAETIIDFCQMTVLDRGGGGNSLANLFGQCQRTDRDEIDKQNNVPVASSSFFYSSLDSGSIVVDTVNSIPRVVSSDQRLGTATSSSLLFLGCSANPITRTSSHSQDTRLSLQSFHEHPVLLLPHHPETREQSHPQPVFFTGTPPPHHHHHNELYLGGSSSSSPAVSMLLSDHKRLLQWDTPAGEGGISTASSSGGFVFDSFEATPMPAIFCQQGQFHEKGGPLQSSNTAPVHAWIDPTTMGISTNDDYHHQATTPGIGFTMGNYPMY